MNENKPQTVKRLHKALKIGKCKNGPPEPLLIDVYIMCKGNDAVGYYWQIRNRILSEAEAMPETDNDVGIRKSDHSRIMLTDTGIFLFSHILSGYMDQDVVIAEWKSLRDLNRLRLDQYNLDHYFDNLTQDQLRRFIISLKGTITPPELQESARYTMLNAKREYRRKRLKSIFSR